MNRLAAIAFVVCAPLLNAGMCASDSQPPMPQPVAKVTCLPLKVWTPDEEAAMGAALAGLPTDSPLVQGFEDYGAMRASDRACLGQGN